MLQATDVVRLECFSSLGFSAPLGKVFLVSDSAGIGLEKPEVCEDKVRGFPILWTNYNPKISKNSK